MRPGLREGLIVAAYLGLVAVGVVTVLLPALQDDRDAADEAPGASGAETTADAGI